MFGLCPIKYNPVSQNNLSQQNRVKCMELSERSTALRNDLFLLTHLSTISRLAEVSSTPNIDNKIDVLFTSSALPMG